MARKKRELESLRAPEPISGAHDLAGFESGEGSLDDWLRRLRCETKQAAVPARTWFAPTRAIESSDIIVFLLVLLHTSMRPGVCVGIRQTRFQSWC